MWQMVKTGSSYASQSELPVTFGLGSAAEVSGLRVKWPGGIAYATRPLLQLGALVFPDPATASSQQER